MTPQAGAYTPITHTIASAAAIRPNNTAKIPLISKIYQSPAKALRMDNVGIFVFPYVWLIVRGCKDQTLEATMVPMITWFFWGFQNRSLSSLRPCRWKNRKSCKKLALRD
jgi:hypothetical protein